MSALPSPEPVFRAIGDPTRRAILDLLRGGDRSAGEIAAAFPISRPAVSKHLRVLREAALVREEPRGRSRIYRLDARPLAALDGWLAHYRVFWAARLHELKRAVERGRVPRPDPENEP